MSEQLATAKVEECKTILRDSQSAAQEGQMIGSDLSVFIDKLFAKLSEWVSGLDLNGWAGPAVHILLHYVMEELVPKLKDMSPGYVDLILDKVVLPLLAKVDGYFHPSSQ